MSIILYGVTSGGTSVPIEVTDEGKLVVDTSKFPTDEFIKQGDDIEAGNITADGTGTFKSDVRIQDGGYLRLRVADDATSDAVRLEPDGDITATGNITTLGGLYAEGIIAGGDCIFGPQVKINGSTSTSGNVFIQTAGKGNKEVFLTKGDGTTYIGGTGLSGGAPASSISLNADGNFRAAGGKCGFTEDGELLFYSRGTRYRAVVQGGNVAAEPFTRAMELQEKAAKLREPRTQDIVPED